MVTKFLGDKRKAEAEKAPQRPPRQSRSTRKMNVNALITILIIIFMIMEIKAEVKEVEIVGDFDYCEAYRGLAPVDKDPVCDLKVGKFF